jgi:hypothetical protein
MDSGAHRCNDQLGVEPQEQYDGERYPPLGTAISTQMQETIRRRWKNTAFEGTVSGKRAILRFKGLCRWCAEYVGLAVLQEGAMPW